MLSPLKVFLLISSSWYQVYVKVYSLCIAVNLNEGQSILVATPFNMIINGEIVFDRLSEIIAKWARPGGDEAHQLYISIASSAREPGFYEKFGIADTVDGRFDTLTLMVVLVIRRMKAMGDDGMKLGQEVIDIMFADMDLSLHEIGVSENKVGKKVKTMATAFMGRRNAYIDALDAKDDAALADALIRNLYRDAEMNPAKNGLVKAIKAEIKALDGLQDSDLLAGRLPPLSKLTQH